LIEYLAKTLKEMKRDCGVGSKGLSVEIVCGRNEEWRLYERRKLQELKGVENTQLQRDVHLFEKGRVLWKTETYHLSGMDTYIVTNLMHQRFHCVAATLSKVWH